MRGRSSCKRRGAVVARWDAVARRRLEDAIRRYVVLGATDAVTEQWALIAARLRGQLKGNGVNDMWIAACALAQPTPIPVVTGNRSDFDRIQAEFPALVIVHPDI